MTEQEQTFLQEQERFQKLISQEDGFCLPELKTAAGVDLAYWKQGETEYAVCCIVVLDYRTQKVLEKKSCRGKITVPYMPGFLAFRELPLVLQTAALLENKPALYIFDGNGYLHPRHMGIATHASFYLNTPTVGIAKTYFRADHKTEYTEPENTAGSYTDIVIGGEVYGRALRTHTGVRPVFVSVGNRVSLDTATEIAMYFTGKESRIPLPTRLADLETHIARKEHLAEQTDVQ